MTKLFYSSYVICALLALFQLVIFFSHHMHGTMAIYPPLYVLASGTSSLILLASIFFPRKARIIALLIFAVSTISASVWEMSIRAADPIRMSTSYLLIEGSIALIFFLVPILGLLSGASLLRKDAEGKE